MHSVYKVTHYSIEPRQWMFVKGYGFSSLAKNMGRNISRKLSRKYR